MSRIMQRTVLIAFLTLALFMTGERRLCAQGVTAMPEVSLFSGRSLTSLRVEAKSGDPTLPDLTAVTDPTRSGLGIVRGQSADVVEILLKQQSQISQLESQVKTLNEQKKKSVDDLREMVALLMTEDEMKVLDKQLQALPAGGQEHYIVFQRVLKLLIIQRGSQPVVKNP